MDENGKFNYHKLKNDDFFKQKIVEIENTDSNKFSSRNEELVFWLNTYNILVLKGVLKKLEKNPNWKGTTGFLSRFLFFGIQKFKIGNEKYSLYQIENSFLRKKFNDPRIHFVINCASSSCPILPDSLFTIENIEEFLDRYTKNFINGSNVLINDKNNEIILNPIFKWYQKDFQENGDILAFIKKYRKNFPPNLTKPKIIFAKYDWSLNKQ